MTVKNNNYKNLTKKSRAEQEIYVNEGGRDLTTVVKVVEWYAGKG